MIIMASKQSRDTSPQKRAAESRVAVVAKTAEEVDAVFASFAGDVSTSCDAVDALKESGSWNKSNPMRPT